MHYVLVLASFASILIGVPSRRQLHPLRLFGSRCPLNNETDQSTNYLMKRARASVFASCVSYTVIRFSHELRMLASVDLAR
jgi:hypothetical protein